MSRFRGRRGLNVAITLLSLLGAVGCAPPGELPSGEGATPAGQQQIPFHEGGGRPSPTGNPSTAQDSGNDAKPETDLPFHDPQNLPAGTLLTVRLKNPISAEHADATAIFEAVVDQPILMEGNPLVPVGATNSMLSGAAELKTAVHSVLDEGSTSQSVVPPAAEPTHMATLPIAMCTYSDLCRIERASERDLEIHCRLRTRISR